MILCIHLTIINFVFGGKINLGSILGLAPAFTFVDN